jgi:peptide/nickel transport system substrate-binding protein
VKTTRRSFIKGAAAGTGGLLLPAPFVKRVYGQGRRTIVFGSGEPLTGNWDPTSHTILAQVNIEGLIFGQLVRCPMKPGNTEEIVYELATSHKVVSPFVMEYTLRKGVKFHNGQEFSAEDVKATMEYASQPNRPAAWYPGPVEVEIVDSNTVRIHTDKSNFPASKFTFLAGFLPMMSAADVKDLNTLKARPNGTGPLKFVEQRGNDTILHKHDDWWQGSLGFDELIFSNIPEGTTRVLALLSGQADIIERLEPEQYDTLAKDARVKTDTTVSTENKYLHFRTMKPPFDNPLIRRAVAHSIDRDQVVQVVGVAAKASNCYIAPTKFGYVDIPGYPTYDPAKAQELLTKAGFPKGNGLPEIEYLVSQGLYPKTKEYGEAITAMLQEQGFNVKLTVMEVAAWLERIYLKKDTVPQDNMTDVGWSTGSPEPDMVLTPIFQSSKALFNGYHDKEIDDALALEGNEPDVAKRREVLQTVTLPKIAEKLPSFSLFTSVLIHASRSNLEGVYYYPNGPMDISKARYT